MGIDVPFTPLVSPPDMWPFAQVALTRDIYHPSTIQAGGSLHKVSFTWTYGEAGLDPSPFIGVNCITPELFWNGGFGFLPSAVRNYPLDAWLDYEKIGEGHCNLTISNFAGGYKEVNAFAQTSAPDFTGWDGYDSGVITTTLGSYYVGSRERTIEPATMPLSLALWGLKYNHAVGPYPWEFVPLGGNGGFTYEATNPSVASQSFAVDCSGLLKTYAKHAGSYPYFTWVVVPANGSEYVADITDGESIAEAIWGMYSEGDFAWQSLGYQVGHDGDEDYHVYAKVGTNKSFFAEWGSASIDTPNMSATGAWALPANCGRVGVHVPAVI